MNLQPEFETERLALRPLVLTDTAFIIALLNSPGWIAYIGERNIRTTDDAVAYINKINSNTAIRYWVVCRKTDAAAIGLITCIKRDYLDHPDIGFAFLPEVAGNGFAYEAAAVVLNFLLHKTTYSTILATTVPENGRSMRLLEKLGLQYERDIINEGETLRVFAIARPRYLFTSERLGFRGWTANDLDAMTAINTDERVMEFFPATQDRDKTADFIKRMQAEQEAKGFCYFAVEELKTNMLIGFIGLHEQTFESPVTPCIDIGWRLHTAAWGKGYATEGAKRCVQYAFETLHLEKLYAFAPEVNLRSVNVMQKAGLHFTGTFIHPLLVNDARLKQCVIYELNNPNQ